MIQKRLIGNFLNKLYKAGFLNFAKKSFINAHALAFELSRLGFEIQSEEFFDEFIINVGNSEKFLAFMKNFGINAGIKVNENSILVKTKKFNDKDIENYINSAKNLSMTKIAL